MGKKSYPAVSEEYKKAIDKCKKKLRGLIQEKQCAPIMLRLAYGFSACCFCMFLFGVQYLQAETCCWFVWYRWHSAGTFDVKTKTGGPFGTIRHPAELAHEANNGLDIAVRLLEPIKAQFPIISYADLYQVFLWSELLNNHDFMNFRIILVCLCNWYFIFVLMKLAGVVAVEVTGGPEIPFHPGRPVSEPFSL